MKFLDIIKTANHNLWRSKLRTFLTVLAIFVGSFTIILNSAINTGVNDFVDRQISSMGGDGFIEVFPSAVFEQLKSSNNSGSRVREYNEKTGSALTATITEDDLDELREVDGVKDLELYYQLPAEWLRLAKESGKKTNKKYSVSVEYFNSEDFTIDLSAGQMTRDADDENEILIDEDWLEPFGLKTAEDAIGKTVEIGVTEEAKCYTVTKKADCIKPVKAKIVGVQAPGVLSMDGQLHINKALNDAILKIAHKNIPEESITTMIATGNVDPDKIDEIRGKFRDLGYEFITIDDTAGMIRTFLDAMLIILNLFGAIALVAAAIGIINTLFMSVQERTREIGLNKALGLSSAKIFLEFSLEAILLGFWGCVGGTLVAMTIGYAANTALHADGGPLATFPTFSLVSFTPETVLPIFALVMVIAFLAGTLPARRAARKDPIEALRYE